MDWDDDENDFGNIDWDAEEARAIAKRGMEASGGGVVRYQPNIDVTLARGICCNTGNICGNKKGVTAYSVSRNVSSGTNNGGSGIAMWNGMDPSAGSGGVVNPMAKGQYEPPEQTMQTAASEMRPSYNAERRQPISGAMKGSSCNNMKRTSVLPSARSIFFGEGLPQEHHKRQDEQQNGFQGPPGSQKMGDISGPFVNSSNNNNDTKYQVQEIAGVQRLHEATPCNHAETSRHVGHTNGNISVPAHMVANPVPQPMQQKAPTTAPLTTLHATICLLQAPNSRKKNKKYSSKSTDQKGSDVDDSSGSLQCSTSSTPRIEVVIGWHDSVAAVLSKLPGGVWNRNRRAWVFPLSMHDRVVESLKRAEGVRVKVEPLHPVPASVFKASSLIPDDSSRYCHIPSSLEAQLMPFQREGVKFGLRHGGRCLIGDEMGLGKTVQALALIAAYRDEWPCLIVAPSSLREQWADSVHRWLGITEDRICVVHTGKDAAKTSEKSDLDFLIISYNFLDKVDVSGGNYKVVVVDESHYIKDSSAKRTKAAMPVLKDAKRCVLLTGTPALNRPKEIFTQLSCLLPSAKLRMVAFGERYCTGNRFDKYGGAQNLEELHAMLRGSVMVRRLKSDVLTELPEKRRQQIFLSLDASKRRELNALTKQFEAVKAAFAKMASINVASGGAISLGAARTDENRAIMEMYRRTAELKEKAVQEYVEMLLDGGQKFLIFAHHSCLMDAIEHTCNRRKGCRYIRIDGKTPSTERSQLVSKFQDDDNVRVAILSIKAAGVGLTLTAASTVVFAEMTWTPGEIIQAEDRAHRIGQASAVNVYFLHVKGSVDEIIWSALQNKLENVAQALDGCERNMDVRKSRIMPEKGQRSLASFLTPVGEESSQVAAENEDKTDADCISLHDEPDATNLRTDDPEKVRKNDRDLHHEEEIRKRTILSPPRILLGRPQVEARLSPVRETESKRSRLLG